MRGSIRWHVVVAGAVLAATGCSKENEVNATSTAAVGQQCAGPDDPGCGTAGACVLGFCRLGCDSDTVCPQGALCLGDHPPYGCADLPCSTPTQPCDAPLTCGIDGKCRLPCAEDADCPRSEHVCLAGTCVSKSEPDSESTWFACNRDFNTNDLVRSAVWCRLSDQNSPGTLLNCNVEAPGWVEAKTCPCRQSEGGGPENPSGGWCLCEQTTSADCAVQFDACMKDQACRDCVTAAYLPVCDALPLYKALQMCNCAEPPPEFSTCEECAAYRGCGDCEATDPWPLEQCRACAATPAPAADACTSPEAVHYLRCPCEQCADACVPQCEQVASVE